MSVKPRNGGMPALVNMPEATEIPGKSATSSKRWGHEGVQPSYVTIPELLEDGDLTYLKALQVAKLLNCSRARIYKMFDEGRIPGSRIDGMIRFDSERIAAWLRESEQSWHH